MNKKFALYSNCILVQGYKEDVIYDVFRSRSMNLKKRISNLILDEFKHQTVDEVFALYPEWKEGLDHYLSYLVDNDFAFYPDEPEKFKALNLEYDTPYALETCVIHFTKKSPMDYLALMQMLSEVRWKNFQFICTDKEVDFTLLKNILAHFDDSDISAVEVLMDYQNFDEDRLRQTTQNVRVAFKIYNTPEPEREPLRLIQNDTSSTEFIYFFERKLDIFRKEALSLETFNINILSFTEAQRHNVGLNKMVCIDKEGNYKNHIGHESTYGNIHSKSIDQLLADESYTNKWYIHNDRIEKCKDCQFRYMCLSTSDIREEDGKYYKIDECSFDPYSNRWEEKSS